MLTVTNKTIASRRPRVARLIPFGAAVLLAFTGALAQTQVPDEMIRKNEITSDDRRFLKALVDANKAGLTGGPAEIKRSRDVLVAPLEKEGISVPFRTAYASTLIDSAELAKLAASESDIVAANALRIAGQSATGSSLNIVLKGLGDPRPQVRYAATVAARAAFTAAKTASALTDEELSRAIRALSDVVTTDTAAQPVDGALQAINAARDIPNNRSIAIQRLADAAGKRMLTTSKNEAFDFSPFLRLTTPLTADIIESAKLTPEARKGILAFAAQMLVAVDTHWKSTEPDAADVQAAKAANTLLSLAGEAVSKREFTVKIDQFVAAGKKEQFQRELQNLLKTLQAEPFNVPADKLKP